MAYIEVQNTGLHIQATYSYSTSTSLHSIMLSSFSPKGFLQSTLWPHQSTEMTLEKAITNIKVRHPLCLFQLPP